MKRIVFLFTAVLAFSLSTDAQLIRVNGYETILNPTKAEEVPENLRAIQYKKYLSQDYKPALVDDFKEKAYLRYNLFKDEMEFVKDENIYYLKKDVGRTVTFSDGTVYKVYGQKGKPHFFKVLSEGKNSLLSRQSVRFIEAKEATSGYDVAKPADYKRRKDVLFITIDGQNLVEVPGKKKSFYGIFGSKASDVKTYIKKNKLNYKKANDLKQVVRFLNGL